MKAFSENQIRSLHAEFKNQKKYIDKLAFFDRMFGIIPFSFPDFDPELRYFFQKENIDQLEALFRKERNNPTLVEKKFFYGESFSFNIKPANSNNSVYSNYILNCFLAEKPRFEDWIREKIQDEKSMETVLDEANRKINNIEYALQNDYDKSFRLQCMSVFFKGFFEAFTNRVNLPGKKRKFIELFLYAQGIIYADYLGSLKSALAVSRNPAASKKTQSLDLPGKLELLKELGIIELIQKKFAGQYPVLYENKVIETICLITGECIDQKDQILSYLSKMELKKGSFFNATPILSGTSPKW
jgi:hypothetical protein